MRMKKVTIQRIIQTNQTVTLMMTKTAMTILVMTSYYQQNFTNWTCVNGYHHFEIHNGEIQGKKYQKNRYKK